MKFKSSPSDLNSNGQNVEEGQYERTSITFAECFDEIKCLTVFRIRYTRGQVNCFRLTNLLKMR